MSDAQKPTKNIYVNLDDVIFVKSSNLSLFMNIVLQTKFNLPF